MRIFGSVLFLGLKSLSNDWRKEEEEKEEKSDIVRRRLSDWMSGEEAWSEFIYGVHFIMWNLSKNNWRCHSQLGNRARAEVRWMAELSRPEQTMWTKGSRTSAMPKLWIWNENEIVPWNHHFYYYYCCYHHHIILSYHCHITPIRGRSVFRLLHPVREWVQRDNIVLVVEEEARWMGCSLRIFICRNQGIPHI